MTGNFSYVQQHYGVPAVLGRRVKVYGRPGVIAEDRGHYIGVNFDADKPGVIRNAHPTSEVEYLGMGEVRPMTRGQRRYRRWLAVGECFENFAAFIKYETARERGGMENAR